ncbi:laminin subunit gamma-1-like isoform X1 [Centruroides sculpturatus]|uniref:laminin subunit gamma-1-like isoform X1 n=1 Tax=Centruroides sculpturatus TaxID=218467 RepID=UPI000C6D44A9|nr:laminin subunit gamma-1-like isoform X1 [Centruroides sculpturatus]
MPSPAVQVTFIVVLLRLSLILCHEDPCYDENGQPKYCFPPFTNVASNVLVEATNTCGVKEPIEYCLHVVEECRKCDAHVPRLSHPPSYITDSHDKGKPTWWQSETMNEGVQFPNQVNITLHLGKTFIISHIAIEFYSSRPESFAIYRRESESSTWSPYQYFSSSCLETYGISNSTWLTEYNQTKPLCSSEYSDISPLTGGIVIFSTLARRQRIYQFQNSTELQEWVKAKDIRLTLDRLNTFRDEIYGAPHVLKSYYYAISDLTIGGICECNGHASQCLPKALPGGIQVLECQCQHFTTGPDCNECLPSHNDVQWEKATVDKAFQCQECNCNSRSEKCYFDMELWERTGHGGHCVECRDYTDGPHCENCKPNHFRRRDGRCAPCNCDPLGSYSLQCDNEGKCQCKPGVEGRRCQRCSSNYFGLSPHGCSSCDCNSAGIIKEIPICELTTGSCRCKEYVEGHKCDRCREGYFDMQEENEFGCVSCFCYGHSNKCRSTPGYYQVIIDTSFNNDKEDWRGEDHGVRVPVYYDPDLQVLQLRSTNSHTMYFSAPVCYLGDQRASYNQYLSFELRFSGEGARAGAEDVIIEGGGLKISSPIVGQGNPMPEARSSQKYKFRLHEHPSFGWQPRLRFHDFMRVLSNVTAIKIRGIYTPGTIGYLDNVRLDSARQTPGRLEATWIETCHCPPSHTGQFCEKCAPGYTRNPPGGTVFDTCVPCSCRGHGDICDPETGACLCKHNTVGERCDRCAPGYYGLVRGAPGDCRPCPCPNQGACVVLPDGRIACRECEIGHTGPKCELCVDGYYGDPKGNYGPPRPCRKCQCNDNIDPNAVGNCNSTTGECLKCIYNTAGRNCEKCKTGYYGNPLAVPRRGCQPCNCYPLGTVQQTGAPNCDVLTGQCRCRANVVGLGCDTCEVGYWNIGSGTGCEKCSCNPIGSYNQTCDVRTGQCHCLPDVTGKHCDTCRPYYYGFSSSGCKPCNCDPVGSTSLQCDSEGQCPCRPNMQGRQCTHCRDNKKFPTETICLDCPACYTLIEEETEEVQNRLGELALLIEEIQNHDEVVTDDFEFRRKLFEVKDSLDKLVKDASKAAAQESPLIKDLKDLREKIEAVQNTAGKVSSQIPDIQKGSGEADSNITQAEDIINQIEESLRIARDYFDSRCRKALQDALDRSEEHDEQSKRMSEIAKEARVLADSHEEMAAEVKIFSDDALNISAEAFQLARSTVDSLDKLNREVYALNKKLNDVEDMINRSKKLSQDAHREGEEAYDKALDVYTDVHSLIIPEVNERRMKDEAAYIIDEAQRIRREADEVEDLHKGTVDKLQNALESLQDLLDAANYQQQLTDELLGDTDSALSKALDAIKLGEDTLKDAQKTLETLKGFDKVVQDSKDKAEDSLKDIPFIRSLIKEAEDKTKEANDALGNAKQDAFEARDIAQQAQRIAEQASKKAKDILQEADKTMALADKLKEQGEELSIHIDDAEEKLRSAEKQAADENQLAHEVLHKSGEIKHDALNVAKNANDALDDIYDILRQLDNLDDVDGSLLNELERKLLRAEKEMRDSDLDAKTADLRDARKKQAGWMRDYESEIELLEKEVENIAAIRASLPDGCYRRVKLEPAENA